MKLGILHSRVRVEEKLLFEEFERRGLNFDLLDDQQMIFDIAGGARQDEYSGYDCVVDALGSFALYAKGREDLEDPRKWERLKLWCDDANAQDAPHRYRALFVRQDAWDATLNPMRTLAEADAAFGDG